MENQNFATNQEVANRQSVVSIFEWIITFILMAIPIVNFVMIFVWAFGGSASASKANWAKAVIVFWIIGIVVAAVFWSVFAAFFLSALNGFNF